MRGCGLRRQRRRAGGFTLLETLVALVVAAMAAAVILAMTRGLMARVEQEHRHERDVLLLINDSLRVAMAQKEYQTQPEPRDNTSLVLRYNRDDLPEVVVRNYSVAMPKLPPITLAYTPLQQFAVERGRYSLTTIAPSLLRPDSIMPRGGGKGGKGATAGKEAKGAKEATGAEGAAAGAKP